MKCSFCEGDPLYAWLHIKKYKYWHIELRSNQNYLGWCLVVLNRHLEDMMDISVAEQKELFAITKNLRNVLKQQFNPTSFNYASLGNVTRHVHLQVVPRYAKTVTFHNQKFIDKNWGKNYSPYDKNFDISQAVKTAIREAIQKGL